MKKHLGIILTAVLSILLVAFAVSCGSVDGISISDEHEFKTVYVRGQELDLSGGVLIVKTGDKTSEIPLDSDEVTVSGYNKDTVGKQTVTVKYEEVTTEFTVTVSERLTVSNAVSEYLVGDQLDRSKGGVTVMLDDGTVKTIALASDDISVVGFDSASACMNQTVKVVYSKDGNTFEGSYSVNVYATDSVDFRRPNKVSYGSHYAGDVDVMGGKLTFRGNGGKLKREVNLTADMVSGFDVSAVNAENSPVTQTLTVTYDGEQYVYDIQLIYTDISLFNDSADSFATIDWQGEELPVIEEELGELALELMQVYTDMSKREKGDVDEAALFDVARAAMVYGFDIWGRSIFEFRDAFALEYGELVLYLDSYEGAKKALELFDMEDNKIYTLGPLLIDIIELYNDTVIYEDIYFSSYPVLDDSTLSYLEEMIEHTVYIYETLAGIPDEWDIADIQSNSTNIVAAVANIFNETYVVDFPNIYYLISEWREEGDLLDILYAGLYELGYKNETLLLSYYGLPSDILVLYGYVVNAVVATDEIQNAKYTDTTTLIYNYLCAVDTADRIKALTDTAENYMFYNLSLNSILGITDEETITFEIMLETVRTSAYGYNHLSSGLLDIREYDELMREYITLVGKLADTEGFGESEEYAVAVKSMFDKFVALSPTQQYNFIATLNSLYVYGTPELAFDTTDEYTGESSLFSFMINSFMRSKLTEASRSAYNNLILAIEVFANRVVYDGWQEDFSARMDTVASVYSQMSEADKDVFDYYLGDAYSKYTSIFAQIEERVELGDWADEFAALDRALADMQTAYYLLYSNVSGNYNYFLASFERASAIAENITKNASPSVVYAYYYSPLFALSGDNGADDAVYASYEYVISTYRNFYVEFLLFYRGDYVNIYDAYRSRELGKFLDVYYDMLSAYINKTESQENVFDREKVLLVLNAFKALDSETKSFFITLEGNVPIYYSALEAFITETFTENAATVAEKLFNLEESYYTYEVTESEVTLNSIRDMLAQLKSLHSGLQGDDAVSFAILDSIYDYYVGKCELLLS